MSVYLFECLCFLVCINVSMSAFLCLRRSACYYICISTCICVCVSSCTYASSKRGGQRFTLEESGISTTTHVIKKPVLYLVVGCP